MPNIHQLSPEITAKIAAGEVIEKPAYAVKELIENSIDAQATIISIDIANAGLDKIVVTDDGIGIDKDDLLLAFLPHTTSKIHDENDLYAISSLGFRGEALASIAAVSQLTLQSRSADTIAGTKAIVYSNKLQDIQPVGMPFGTKVIVEHLFSNIPVRKKFLKSIRTEFRAIVDIVVDAALAHPAIGFQLIHNEKTVFKLPPNQDLLERGVILLGQSISENSIPLSFQENYLCGHGFIGKPQLTFGSPQKLFFIVNNRRIHDSLLLSSMKDAYANLVEKTMYPFGIIVLSVPFELVDVNIHPRKEQIKFTDPHMIAFGLGKAVRETLENNNLTFFNIAWKQGLTKTPLARELKKQLQQNKIAQLTKIAKEADISQIHNLYLTVETEQGLMIIDQHAAHEAILFDALKTKYFEKKHDKTTIALSPAIFIELSVSEMQVFEEFQHYFLDLGFEIEEFGNNTIKITNVPEFFQDFDMSALFAEILADFVNHEFPKDIDQQSMKMLSFLACRNAVKSGESLTISQRKKLIESLQDHHYTYTCPHGRPVKIEFSLQEIDRMFKRK